MHCTMDIVQLEIRKTKKKNPKMYDIKENADI